MLCCNDYFLYFFLFKWVPSGYHRLIFFTFLFFIFLSIYFSKKMKFYFLLIYNIKNLLRKYFKLNYLLEFIKVFSPLTVSFIWTCLWRKLLRYVRMYSCYMYTERIIVHCFINVQHYNLLISYLYQ